MHPLIIGPLGGLWASDACGSWIGPWCGFIIPSLLKKICPHIKRVLQGPQQLKFGSTRIKNIFEIVQT